MSAYHCGKLCDNACCAPLRWALDCEYDNLPSCGCESALYQAQLVADDPAKLAELGVMALRVRGVDACVFGDDCFPWQWGILATEQWIEILPHDVPERIIYSMPQFRALLARIITTPPDESSRDECERIIRGET